MCHFADAVRLWTSQFQTKVQPGEGLKSRPKPSLDFDFSSILSGRKYATSSDDRLADSAGETLWHWADTRAEGLALETLNGLDVGRYHDIRDKETLRSWNAQLRIVDGLPVTEETLKLAEQATAGRRGRKPGSRLIDGRVVGPDEIYEGSAGHAEDKPKVKSSSQMAGAALVSTDEEDGDVEDDDDRSLPGGGRLMTGTNDPEVELDRWKKPLPKSLTKRQIMTSIEAGGEFADEVMSEDEDWNIATLPVRGGTEESEGGDYNPRG